MQNDITETSWIDSIFYIRHCLKYEAREDIVGITTRENWDRKKKSDQNAYFKRITPERYDREQQRLIREATRRAYTKAIAKKYNVGENWRENRWFVEQVRPTL